MNYKCFVKRFLTFSTILIFILFVVNFVVDPYGLNNIVQITNINKIKTQTENKNRKYKIRLAEKVDFTGLFLGTSRMERLGNTTFASEITKHTFFNLAFGAQTIYESYKYLNYISKIKDMEILILSIEAYQFYIGEKLYEQDSPERIISKFNDIQYYFHYATLFDSIKTIFKNVFIKPIIYNEYGWRILDEFQYFGIDKKDEEAYLLSKLNFDRGNRYGCNEINSLNKLDDEKVQYLFKIIELCERENIELILYFNPVFLSVFHQENVNQVENVIELKKLIVKKKPFFDFSGINMVTSNYQNFWDGSHAMEKVSKPILELILLNKYYKDFGTYVTEQNIDAHINKFLYDIKQVKDKNYIQQLTN